MRRCRSLRLANSDKGVFGANDLVGLGIRRRQVWDVGGLYDLECKRVSSTGNSDYRLRVVVLRMRLDDLRSVILWIRRA